MTAPIVTRDELRALLSAMPPGPEHGAAHDHDAAMRALFADTARVMGEALEEVMWRATMSRGTQATKLHALGNRLRKAIKEAKEASDVG